MLVTIVGTMTACDVVYNKYYGDKTNTYMRHAHTHTHTRTHTRTHAHTHKHTQDTRKHAAHTHTHTRTKHAHAHSHTHTHILSLTQLPDSPHTSTPRFWAELESV